MRRDSSLAWRRVCRTVPVGSLVAGFALALSVEAAAAQVPNRRQPNVVLIITDDVGYGDIGSYGATDIRTPHIDRLAREGVRLTDFYASPQCTPTRASLISGRYPQRFAMERALGSGPAAQDSGLPVTGRSLPQLLKNAGYATGLVGKWHLGYRPEFSPMAHGFDYFFGFLSGYIDFYQHTRGGDAAHDLYENGQPVHERGYATDLITARALRFIDQHRQAPFFLEVAYNATHWPFQPPDEESRAPENARFPSPGDRIKATRRDYAAMLERADAGVGQLMRRLSALGLSANTLVIFTNDNGGEWLSSNAPLFHRKDTLWEGGIRVPAILRWPGRLPAGRVSGQVGVMMDVTATILAAAGAAVPPGAPLDGIDLVPHLRVGAAPTARSLFWRIATRGRQQRAVREGDWKLLLDDDDVLLFNVREDLGERRDVAWQHPERVARLRALLSAWERDVDAESGRR